MTENQTPGMSLVVELPTIQLTGKRSQQRTADIIKQFTEHEPEVSPGNERSHISNLMNRHATYWQAVMAWGWSNGELGVMKHAHDRVERIHDAAIKLAVRDLWDSL